jgi:hypothetical protein
LTDTLWTIYDTCQKMVQGVEEREDTQEEGEGEGEGGGWKVDYGHPFAASDLHVCVFCQTRPKARFGLNSTIELDTLKLLFNLTHQPKRIIPGPLKGWTRDNKTWQTSNRGPQRENPRLPSGWKWGMKGWEWVA